MSMFNRRPLNLPTPLPLASGGHGATNPAAARAVLGMAGMNQLDQPNGLAQLDASGKLPGKYFEQLVEAGSAISTSDLIGLEGEVLVIAPNQTILFNITDFDSFTNYAVSTTVGAVVRTNTQISFIAPGAPGSGILTINNRQIQVQVRTKPAKPTLSVVQANGAGGTTDVTLNGTAFSVVGGTTHLNSDWQIASDVNFTNIVYQSMADAVGKTSKSFTGLPASTTFHARVRYRDSTNSVSDWANTQTFTTLAGVLPISSVSISGNAHPIGDELVAMVATVSPAGNGNYTYQWQRFNGSSWVNYGSPVVTNSATNSIFFDNSTVALDNSNFRCNISNPVNNMTTASAWYKIRTVEIGIWLKGRTVSHADNFASSTVSYFAKFWGGNGSANQSNYVEQLWPNNTGQDVIAKITPPISSDSKSISGINWNINGVTYTAGNSGSLLSEISGSGYYLIAPGTSTGQAITALNNLSNNGTTGSIQFSVGSAGANSNSKNLNYNVFERVIPAGFQWDWVDVAFSLVNSNPIYTLLDWQLRTTTGFATAAGTQATRAQVVSGSLPPGITVPSGSTGPGSSALNSKMTMLSGAPTTHGSYNFTLRVNWNPDHTSVPFTDYPISVSVTAWPFTLVTTNWSLPVNQSITFTPRKTIVSDSTGSGIGSAEIASGSLPPGVSISANQGGNGDVIITGTPTQTGTFNFTVRCWMRTPTEEAPKVSGTITVTITA